MGGASSTSCRTRLLAPRVASHCTAFHIPGPATRRPTTVTPAAAYRHARSASDQNLAGRRTALAANATVTRTVHARVNASSKPLAGVRSRAPLPPPASSAASHSPLVRGRAATSSLALGVLAFAVLAPISLVGLPFAGLLVAAQKRTKGEWLAALLAGGGSGALL